MNRIPYTYIIKNKTTKYFYYGVRYGKKCNPSDLWKSYFTSSNRVKRLIKKFGCEDFDYKVVKIFNDINDALVYEEKIIRKIIKHKKCINIMVGTTYTKESYEKRKEKDEEGLSSYQRAGLKLKQTLKNNPDIIKKRTESLKQTLSKINPDNGLTIAQERGLQFRGENNSSKRKEVRKKISNSVKKWHINNPDKSKIIKKIKKTKLKKGFDGLNINERHSLNMQKSGNPCFETIWINNGEIDIRIKIDEIIPNGFGKGRIVYNKGYEYKKIKCPFCGKIGGGGNMKRYHFENCKERIL